ncbi:MAG: hypothetical protein M0Z31_00050 [Clostridia bacterium]|nr:hypothetical protein [Clostridia bacterium]
MKIGDIVTTKQYGPSVHFCVLGYLIDENSGEKIAVIALVEQSLIRTASQKDLVLVSLAHLFAKNDELNVLH